jgi:tetratricopeptide (TPR) repeat protein
MLDAALRKCAQDGTLDVRALPILEEPGDLVLQSNLLNNLGIEAYMWAAGTKPLSCTGGELSRRAGDVVNVARAQNNEEEIVSDQGKLEEAEKLLVEAQRVWRPARYPVGVALARSNLGRVAARAGRFDEALGLFDEALAAFRALGSEVFVQETEARRAECLVLAGRFQEALEIVPGGIEAVEGTPQLGAFLERLYGYALVQARRADEAPPALRAEHRARPGPRGRVRGGADAGGARPHAAQRSGGRRGEQGDARAPRRAGHAARAAAVRRAGAV